MNPAPHYAKASTMDSKQIPEYSAIDCGGYVLTVHQPSAGPPHPPLVTPRCPTIGMVMLRYALDRAHWPSEPAEYPEQISALAELCRWITYRGVAALRLLARGEDPRRPLHDLLSVDPFSYTDDEVSEATEAGNPLLPPPDLAMLQSALPDLARPVLVHLADRVHAVLSNNGALVHDLAATAAAHAVHRASTAPWGLVTKPAEVARVAAALACTWYTVPELRVPLACAWAVTLLLTEWAADSMDVDAGLIPAVGLRRYGGDYPEVAEPVPDWARGLLDSHQDIEVWRG
jgi:hypothetical protein